MEKLVEEFCQFPANNRSVNLLGHPRNSRLLTLGPRFMASLSQSFFGPKVQLEKKLAVWQGFLHQQMLVEIPPCFF